MSGPHEWPQNNWLQRETPLGIPIFTPFNVRPWTENCLFAVDAQIVRMVYIGGLATNDPTVLVWTLYAPAPPERRGVELRRPWLTSREQFSVTLLDAADRPISAVPLQADGHSYSYRLRLIENISGLSDDSFQNGLTRRTRLSTRLLGMSALRVPHSLFVSLRCLA